MGMLSAARAGLTGLVDLALPSRCVGCGTDGPALCRGCGAELVGHAYRTRPDPAPDGLPSTWAVAAYAGVVRAAVVAHKEDGRRALARPLGAALASSVAAADDRSALVLVPAPSRPTAVRARGGDPTLALARAAAAALRQDGRDCQVVPALRVRRGVRDQAGLGAAARAANLAGRMTVSRSATALLTGRLAAPRVLVVDDVVTTGATVAEAARALRAAGVEVGVAAVVAATRRTGVSPRAGGG